MKSLNDFENIVSKQIIDTAQHRVKDLRKKIEESYTNDNVFNQILNTSNQADKSNEKINNTKVMIEILNFQ